MSCEAHALAASRRYLAQEDVDCIRSLAALLPENALVANIGAGAGTTALAVFAERPAATIQIVSIDNREEELHWMVQAVDNIGRAGDHREILDDAIRASDEFQDRSVDLLMVDLSYSVREVMEAWFSKLKPGGLLWMHDYGDPRAFGIDQDAVPEVRIVADELASGGFVTGARAAGLGWCGRVAATIVTMIEAPSLRLVGESP
jgi:SAM-dependent methyltransferase